MKNKILRPVKKEISSCFAPERANYAPKFIKSSKGIEIKMFLKKSKRVFENAEFHTDYKTGGRKQKLTQEKS